MKSLVIQRLDTANYLGKIGVYCDGEKLGKLAFAERGEFTIPANAREVYVKIDWCKSKPHKLESGNNEEVLFVECSNSAKNIFITPSQYLKLHPVKRKDLPTQSELLAFRRNFRRVAGLSTVVLLLFIAVLLYTMYVAISENAPLWYVLTALAAYNIYRISRGIRKRLKGQV